MAKEILFSDYIELCNKNDDSYLYNFAYSLDLGLYLNSEDEKPIKSIALIESKPYLFYIDGDEKIIDDEIVSVKIMDKTLKQKLNISVVGNIFHYDLKSARKSELDISHSLNKELVMVKVRKRSR